MFNFGYFRNGAVWTAFFGGSAVFFINVYKKQVSQNVARHFGSGEAGVKASAKPLKSLNFNGTVSGTETAPLRCLASEKQHRNGVAKKRHQNNFKRGIK